MAAQHPLPSKPCPFTLGVLLLPPVQLLDLSPTDLFGMLTPSYLRDCNLPTPLLNLGVEVEIYYISESHVGSPSPSSPSITPSNPQSNLVPLTSSATILSTHFLTHPDVSPPSTTTTPVLPKLSAILIPGPPPTTVPSNKVTSFLRAHANAGTDILTVCTGVFIAGHAGLLDGRKCTGPRALVGGLKKMFPSARFGERRWECDFGSGSTSPAALSGGGVGGAVPGAAGDIGAKTTELSKEGDTSTANGNGEAASKQTPHNQGKEPTPNHAHQTPQHSRKHRPSHLWTSGGISNGQDMVVAYLRGRGDVFSTELVDLVSRMSDIGNRSQDYDVGGLHEGGWWVWLILRSWWRGLRRVR